jgi:enoyl-CoA hydratase/carnithine racemase
LDEILDHGILNINRSKDKYSKEVKLREEWFNLSFSIDGGIGTITLADETGENLISTKFLRELKNGLKVFHHSKDVKVILIKGNEKCFSRGIDLKEINNHNNVDVADFLEFGWKVFNKLSEIRKPIISQVTGDALDGGFELTLLSDLVYASSNAHFGFPGTKVKNSPVFGGITNLIDLVGIRFTKELLFRGHIITAREALDKGIVNDIFEPDKLNESVLDICKDIVANNSAIFAFMKESVGKLIDVNRRLRLPDEIDSFTICKDIK